MKRKKLRSSFLIFILLHAVTNILAQSEPKLKITSLSGNFYVYTTNGTYEGGQVPANGMYLLTENGAILFDTPWDTTQFQPLLDSIKMKHHKNVVMCIATHWHSDKTAGLEYYRQKGIKTYTTQMTDDLSKQHQMKRAEFLMTKDTVFKLGKYSFETYYPGPGHTTDNIIIWFPKEKILYGGCLIKSANAKNLGFLGDGNITEYESTLKRTQQKFKNPKFIVISHGDWNDIHSLTNSIILARKLKSKIDD